MGTSKPPGREPPTTEPLMDPSAVVIVNVPDKIGNVRLGDAGPTHNSTWPVLGPSVVRSAVKSKVTNPKQPGTLESNVNGVVGNDPKKA